MRHQPGIGDLILCSPDHQNVGDPRVANTAPFSWGRTMKTPMGFYTPKYRGYFNRENIFKKNMLMFFGGTIFSKPICVYGCGLNLFGFLPGTADSSKTKHDKCCGPMGVHGCRMVLLSFCPLFGSIWDNHHGHWQIQSSFFSAVFSMFFGIGWDRWVGPLLLDAESKNLFVHSSHFGLATFGMETIRKWWQHFTIYVA